MMSSASPPVEAYRSYKDAPNYGVYRNVGFNADRLEEIVDSVNFEHWEEFRDLAERAKHQSNTISSAHQTILRKQFTSQEFENVVPEALEILSKIVAQEGSGLSNLRLLVGEPALTYGPEGGSHLVLHDVGMYTDSSRMPPDTGVRTTEAWENGGDLLPSSRKFKSVANAYNWYFRSCRERNEESNIADDCLLNQISELVLTALHTRSGWYCLHRRSEAVFVQVDPIQASETRWLTVRVSDIYTPNDMVSILDGLRSLFQACKVADDTKLKQFGDIATRLMSCTAQMHGRSVPGTEQNNDSKGRAAGEWVDHLNLTDSDRRMLQRAICGETLLQLNPGDLARLFLVNCRGYIGRGCSGYVVRSYVNGVNFAVKRWSKYEWDINNAGQGLMDLQYEMEIYAYLHKYHPQVLGRILPRPIAICRDTNVLSDPALVLAMVGERIERKGYNHSDEDCKNEVWAVNGEELSKEDMQGIRKAAHENSKELEALGIEDYDVRGFNIRVDRIKNERGESKWHVWTIDLGRCRVFRDEKELDIDSLRALVCETSPGSDFNEDRGRLAQSYGEKK